MATGNLLRKKNIITVPVTRFKYLPFSAGKTAHLDRLCLEKIPSKTVGPMSVDCLSVCCKQKYITIKQIQMFCYSGCYN